MKIKVILVVSAVATAATAGAYLGFSKFLRDRQRAAGYRGGPDGRIQRNVAPDGRTVKTYTAKELEEARKTGKLPKGTETTSASQAAAANEAAVQRTLRTLEEINKINEMNRRLQEQQQRMQRQNK